MKKFIYISFLPIGFWLILACFGMQKKFQGFQQRVQIAQYQKTNHHAVDKTHVEAKPIVCGNFLRLRGDIQTQGEQNNLKTYHNFLVINNDFSHYHQNYAQAFFELLAASSFAFDLSNKLFVLYQTFKV